MTNPEKKSKIWPIIGIVIAVILAFPTWEYWLKEKFRAPGPIYASEIDQTLRTMLKDSEITKKLKGFDYLIIKGALDIKLSSGKYKGKGSWKWAVEKMYISLLEDILSTNEDKVGYYVTESDRKVIIWPKNALEQLPRN